MTTSSSQSIVQGPLEICEVKTTFIKILWPVLPFSLSSSHECIVEFSRGCMMCYMIFFKSILMLNLFIYLFIYFLAVLGLRFCARAFSSCSEWGPLFIAVRGPLTIVASLVAEHRLQTRRLSSCGSRAQSLRGMWDLPRPELEPVFPALAGRFSTTAPPGKPYMIF